MHTGGYGGGLPTVTIVTADVSSHSVDHRTSSTTLDRTVTYVSDFDRSTKGSQQAAAALAAQGSPVTAQPSQLQPHPVSSKPPSSPTLTTIHSSASISPASSVPNVANIAAPAAVAAAAQGPVTAQASQPARPGLTRTPSLGRRSLTRTPSLSRLRNNSLVGPAWVCIAAGDCSSRAHPVHVPAQQRPTS